MSSRCNTHKKMLPPSTLKTTFKIKTSTHITLMIRCRTWQKYNFQSCKCKECWAHTQGWCRMERQARLLEEEILQEQQLQVFYRAAMQRHRTTKVMLTHSSLVAIERARQQEHNADSTESYKHQGQSEQPERDIRAPRNIQNQEQHSAWIQDS